MFESYSQESIDDELEEQFRSYVLKEQFTTEEMREAYFKLCGISKETEESERVNQLWERMEELSTQNHFPLNRFVDFVNELQDIEDSAPRYFEFVEHLDISKNEKKLLHSIVEKNRTGTLEFHINEDVAAKIHIKDKKNQQLLAGALLEVLKQIRESMVNDPESKMSFWFEED